MTWATLLLGILILLAVWAAMGWAKRAWGRGRIRCPKCNATCFRKDEPYRPGNLDTAFYQCRACGHTLQKDVIGT